MAVRELLCVSVSGADAEEVYFHEQEQARVRALRQAAQQEADRMYREEHKGHCFRCGTPSLVEVTQGSITIDVCINEGCGAVHLDHGELENIIRNHNAIKKVHSALFAIFK